MNSVRRTRTLSVLHISGGLEWRGREMQALALATGLAAKGHRPVMAATAESPLADRARGAGIEVAPLAAGTVGRIRDLRRLLGRDPLDVMHFHDAASLRTLAWAGAGLPRIPCVLTVPGDVLYGSRVLPRGTPIRRVDQFFAVSEWVWSALVRAGIPESRISVIPTAVDLDRFKPAPAGTRRGRDEMREGLGLGPGDFVIGTVLHLTKTKGVEVLIEAARRIRKGEPPPGEERVRVLIVGDGPRKTRLEADARRLSMGDAVIFTGHRDDVPELMAAMDVYVHPAVSGDGFPVAMREAMAMTVPAIATDLMGIREIMDNGKQGLIAPAGDAEALALNIMRLRRDPAYARQIGKGGSLKVQRYGLRATVDRAEELYFRLVR